MSSDVQVVRSELGTDGVLWLRLCDEAHQNRFSDALCDQLMAALARAAEEPAVRCVVLGGMPTVFSTGATLERLERMCRGESPAREFALPRAVLAFPLPVVAAMRGDAVGGGLLLGLYCDVVLASERRRYGFNFTDLGFTPGIGATAMVSLAVGHHVASEMLFTARYFRGRELSGTRLFNAVVPEENVEPLARETAARIAEKPRRVLELLKKTLAAPRLAAFDGALAREHEMHEECFALPETAARISAEYLRGSS